MKQVKHTHQEAYQELLTVARWTIQMLDQNAIACGGNIANQTGVDKFCNWATAVRVAVAKTEMADASQQQIKRTHTDVVLPRL